MTVLLVHGDPFHFRTNDMTKIRWGLLSTADINGEIIRAIRASARGEVAAVSSRVGAKAQSYAAQFLTIPTTSAWFRNLKELYIGEIEDMQAAILDHVPNYVTLQESRDHIRTVQALYRSETRSS